MVKFTTSNWTSVNQGPSVGLYLILFFTSRNSGRNWWCETCENWVPLTQTWKACSYRQFTRVKMGPTAKYKWWPPILSWCDMGVYPRNRVPMGTPKLNIKWLTITLSIEIDNQVWISHFWTTLYDTIWSIEQCQNLLALSIIDRWWGSNTGQWQTESPNVEGCIRYQHEWGYHDLDQIATKPTILVG